MSNNSNIKDHVQTYDGLIGLLKFGSIGAAIIAAIVIWLIAR